jgi:FKBP-type peptidyl-prolyl cis-trans isomerase
MIPLNARRFWRIGRRYAVWALLCICALSSNLFLAPDITARAQTSDQVWTDPDTKLMWAAKDNGGYVPPSYGLLSQKEAAAYCQNSRLAGFHDWRLPTIEELEQISEKTGEGYHVKGGVIKLSGDPTGEDNHMYAQVMVWSQTERADQDAIWEFHFGKYGGRNTTVGGMGIARALCVRGGAPPAPAGRGASAVPDMSKYVTADGITIPSGASGAARGSGVYFTTVGGHEMPISLRGNPASATLNYTGTMEAARDGKLAGGTEDFKPTRIETSRNPDKWLRIASFTIGKDGFLVVTDESGASYRIKVAPVSMTGTIEELKQQSPAATPPPAAKTLAAPAAKKPAATSAAKEPAPLTLTTQKDKASYAIGMNVGKKMGKDLKEHSVDLDQAILLRGMKDGLAGGKTLLTDEEATAAIVELQKEVAQAEADDNKKKGAAFLAENKTKEGVVTLPSGLQYKILQPGAGPKPTVSDTVVCNYRGTLIDGKEFDSSAKHGKPATFPVGQVIKGWTEALQLMPVGSKWQLFLPPDLAYGERSMGPDITPFSTLIFEVELVSIRPPEKPAEKPAVKPAANPAANPADKPADKPAAANPPAQSSDKPGTPEPSAEKPKP